MKIAVLSGKGSTGKTTVSASLAASLGNCQYVDCDVETINVALFMNPQITQVMQKRKGRRTLSPFHINKKVYIDEKNFVGASDERGCYNIKAGQKEWDAPVINQRADKKRISPYIYEGKKF